MSLHHVRTSMTDDLVISDISAPQRLCGCLCCCFEDAVSCWVAYSARKEKQ